MDFELIPSTAQAPQVKPNNRIDDVDQAKDAGMYTDEEQLQVSVFDDETVSAVSEHKQKAQVLEQQLLSEFTFTEGDNEFEAEDAIEKYLRLKVPITYHVKFNFTPEK